MVEVVVLSTGVIVTVLSGLFVFSRNPKHIVNRLYGLLSLCLASYITANHLSLQTDDRLLYIRIVIASSSAAVALVYYLVTKLKNTKKELTPLQKAGILATLAIIILDFTPFIFSGLNEGQNPAPVPGIGVLFFVFHLLVFLLTSLIFLAKNIRRSRGRERLQHAFILIAIGPMLLLAPITGFVLPVLFRNVSLVVLNPAYSIFFVLVIGYLIVKHRLFDVKLIVARSIGYLLSIFLVASLFSFFAFLLVNFLTNNDLNLLLSQQILFTATAVLLAFIFQPVKSFFDKLSNALFYRDAYDPQELLDELNKVLVSKVDVEPLLVETTSVIKSHLKSMICAFSLRKTQYIDNRIIGEDTKKFNNEDIEQIGKLVSRVHQQVIVTDDLDEDQTELRDLLRKNDIAVLTRLVTTVEYDLEGVGYLMLGTKRSGSLYGRQDVKAIEIIANELVIAIQNALRFEEIEKFNVTLQQKVDDATKKLRHTNEKLKEMDETKDEFISMASHQLRTPLTSVKGYLSMVLEGDAGDVKPMQEKLLNQAFTSSQRMVYLIADLLNVSRLRTGKFVIESIKANLADIVDGEVQQLKETASSRKLDLVYEKPENFPTLMLDETKLRQVVMNFIDNAIYYTPSGGTITVKLEDKQNAAEYTVTDTGMGVPKADQQHLFTKFYRAGNARKARPDGTGLGLFMSKKVIIAQGGAIIFKSKEGEGSTFGFTLPKEKLIPKDIEPAEDDGAKNQ